MLAVSVLLLAVGLLTATGPGVSATRLGTATNSSRIGTGTAPPQVGVRDAYLELVPEGSAPRNGGTAYVGDRFVLALYLNTGSYPDWTAAQQSYLTFPKAVLQNARVSQIATACVLTSTVTPDTWTFNTVLQNEVCNGPSPCNFPIGGMTDPGSIAYAMGTLGQCPGPTCPVQYFRVAEIGLCAVGPGRALLHWQFSPPAPSNRDTAIVDYNNQRIDNPDLFTDYAFNVIGPSEVISGHVYWQGRPPQPNPLQQLPITLTLKSATTEINYPVRATDASGYFTEPVAGLAAGTYNWRVKHPKYLANSGSVALTGVPTTSVEIGSMRAGDADNNNMVDIADFIILKGSFGRAVGQPGYDDRAEFSGDERVNVIDYALLRANFASHGAPPIGPVGP